MEYAHDHARTWLTSGPNRAAVLGRVVGFVALLVAVGAAAVLLQSLLVAVAGALLWALAVIAMVIVSLVRGPPTVEVRVDPRWITLTGREGGRVRWTRRVSVLDVHRAVVAEGELVLNVQPGPRSDLHVDARGTSRADLEALAAVIDEAVARANHRGDAPDRAAFAAAHLLQRNVQ